MAGKPEFQQRLETIEDLISQIEGAADPAVRTAARELAGLVMELHASGLDRMLELLRADGAPGVEWIDRFGRDEMISSLLVLHGLHPMTLEARVETAIAKLRPRLKKRAAEVELIAIENGVPRVRLRATGNAAGLKEALEDAILSAAPDVSSIVVEGPEERAGFVPLDMLRTAALPALNGKGAS